MSEQPWDHLVRHPDGRVRLLFDDYAALHPERYGEPDMPKEPQPKAPLPGHQVDPVPAEPASVHPASPTAAPVMPTEIGVDTSTPNLYGDGAPFTMTDSRRSEPPAAKLVIEPRPGAARVDLASVVGPDPLDAFVVLQSDVWEEFTPAGSTTPSFSLKFSRGQRVPRSAIAGLKVLAVEQNMPGPMEVK